MTGDETERPPDPRESASTLADLGELTAQFLEGRIRDTPGFGGPPDPETTELIPVLAAVNRAGFVTRQSQPGIPLDRHGSAQRANVSGYADPGAFARLMTAASGGRPDRHRRLCPRRQEGPRVGPLFAITLDEGEEFTWDGLALPQSELVSSYEEVCHPRAICSLFNAWQVTLIDPVWGRNDVLWPVLQAFAVSTMHMTKSPDGPVHDQA